MIIFFDIETQELVPENRDLSQMRISIAGIRQENACIIFTEEGIHALFPLLDAAELIVGHNLLGFDYKILQRYADFDVCAKYKHKTFDFLHIIMHKTDRRVALNDLAQRNLGIAKNGHGKDAPALFHQGKIEELKAYLEQDLLILQRIYEHIKQHGKLKYGHLVYKEPVERELLITLSDR